MRRKHPQARALLHLSVPARRGAEPACPQVRTQKIKVQPQPHLLRWIFHEKVDHHSHFIRATVALGKHQSYYGVSQRQIGYQFPD